MAVTKVERKGRVPLMLRVSPELRRRVKADAGAHDVSMNEHAIAILDRCVPNLDTETRIEAG